MAARRRSVRRCRNSMIAFREAALNRSQPVGLEMIWVRKNDGHKRAACATSPHSPQPTQLSMTLATGSFRSGSGLGAIVRDGHPDNRIHEWSPVQVSASTPNFSRTTSNSGPAVGSRSRRTKDSYLPCSRARSLPLRRAPISHRHRALHPRSKAWLCESDCWMTRIKYPARR